MVLYRQARPPRSPIRDLRGIKRLLTNLLVEPGAPSCLGTVTEGQSIERVPFSDSSGFGGYSRQDGPTDFRSARAHQPIGMLIALPMSGTL
jgi:hypothetical protein